MPTVSPSAISSTSRPIDASLGISISSCVGERVGSFGMTFGAPLRVRPVELDRDALELDALAGRLVQLERRDRLDDAEPEDGIRGLVAAERDLGELSVRQDRRLGDDHALELAV